MKLTPRNIVKHLKRLNTLDAPVKTTLGLALQATGLSRHIIIRRANYRIRFSPESSMALSLWLKPHKVIREDAIVARFLFPGAVMIDVGANIGTITLPSANRVGETGQIIAVEPHPKTFRCLQDNVTLNGFGNITPFNYAIGAEEGTAYFSDLGTDDQNRITTTGIPVDITTLDRLVADCGLSRVDVLKIDVEGYEKNVLLGAEHALSITKAILIETSDENLMKYGTHTGEIASLLAASGFSLFRVSGRSEEILALREPAAAVDESSPLALSPYTPPAA